MVAQNVQDKIVDAQPHTTDEMLAYQLRTNAQVLGEIIERYEKKLSLYIGRKSHATPDDRKDILQNIFIKVYKNIYDFDTALSFSSWIYRIAHNEMIDWYRKEKRRPHLSLEGSDYILQTLAAEGGAVEQAIRNEQKVLLQKAVESLSDDYRDVVELRFFEEKSYDEIADILAIPPGTVAVRINRVKKQLQQILAHHE